MTGQKRTLNIPMYDIRESTDATGVDDEDVIDADTMDLDPTVGERLRAFARGGAESVSEAVRNVRLNGVRDSLFTQRTDARRAREGSVDAGAHQRFAGREQRSRDEQARKEQRAAEREATRERARLEREASSDPLTRLRLDTAQAGERYMLSLRQSGLLGSDQTRESQRRELSGLHQVYASMMVLQCVRPLQQGLSGQNIVSTLGMAASMWALSPDFRTQVGSFVGKIGDAIQEKIDSKGKAEDERARQHLEKLRAAGKADQLSSKWRKRLDKIAYAERGHRLPFTAQSAAMTEVALAEAAYEDERKPGADVDAIRSRHREALGVLYGYVEQDGIDPEDVSRSMRVIIGQRMEREPELASVFGELGHGRFVKTPPREVYVQGTGEVMTVWTGDFVDVQSGRTVSSGSFSPRAKMGIDEHRTATAGSLFGELRHARTPEQMNDALTQFMVAASVHEFPGVVDQISDPQARSRFAKARTMFTSMEADGLSEHEQHFAYSAAFVDAVEVAQVAMPELAQAWVGQYGEDWKDRVSEEIWRYRKMGAAATESPSPEPETVFHATPSAQRAEDIVDADVVFDAEDPVEDRAPRGDRYDDSASADQTRSNRSSARHRRLEEPVYEGELLDDDGSLDELELDAESLSEVGPASARKAILAAAESTTEHADQTSRSAAGKIRRARVNQHYNEVETGGITGFGSDEAQPLQDVDYQLG